MAHDDSLDSSLVDLSGETIGTKDRRHSGGSDIEVESKISDSGNRVVPAISLSSEATYHDDLSLENHILANTDQNLESLIITRDAKTLSSISRIQALINILNDAMNENNFKKLDEVVENIKSYEDSFVADLDVESFKNFCIDYLSLKLEDQRVESFEERQSRGDHSYIFSNILSHRYDIEKNNCNYSAKELLLLAIAANDKLAEKYQDILFAEGNLSLLPLLIGSQKYIAAFIERFPDLYIELKDQVVQLNELNKIGFFSVIALRKEQNLLDTVLIEYVLKDLEQVLQTSINPLYGVLETASLVQNEEFIEKVLDVVEGDVKFFLNDLTRKTLLKNSFITLLETAISQEHVSIVEYLCRERIQKKDPIIQKIYKEAFADEKIVAQIDKQILKNIHSAGVERKEKKQKIYGLILKAALHTGSTDFIIKVLNLIKDDPKFLSDTDRQTFLQNSLVTILDNVIREKRFSIIQNVYTNFILKLAENSGVEFLTIQQRYRNACHTSISVDNNVAGQFNEEPNGDNSSLEQNEFEITDIQEEQRPGILGPNKTEIAGFSQEKLLEIINFVKIGYYVSDCNLNNKKFSELEERSYRVPAQLKKEGYKIIQFYNMRDNEQPYRHAGYVFIKDKEITIVYRGSRNLFDYITDIRIPLICAPELLPEGGKIHSGFYSLFKDSWGSVYEILKGHANDKKLEIKDFKFNLTGHSMGGAIANIAALHLSVEEGAEDLHVATLASPRVFDPYAAKVYEERLRKNTIRVVNLSDFIPSLPSGSMGYKHVGEQLRISSSSLLYAHSLDMYRNLIVNIEPDKFKSDNSVSIYYYPSYLATVLYNIITAPSYLIPSTHSNGDEQYFKQVKNKHKDASLSEMMKYSGSSNEQKVVIYEHSEPGEDGFITFVMLSLHKHGRSKGLKINLPDIAFFVNNNYYLSGNTISPRLSKTFKDNSNSKDKQTPVQQAIPIVPEELAAQTPPVTLIEDDVAIVSQASTSNDQTTPQQESVVLSIGNSTSRALYVATSDAQQVVPRGGTVGTIEALKNLPNNRTIKIFLLNNVQSVAQIFKKSDREAELSLPNGNTYELDLHLINEESLKVLFNKENSVLANAINDFSTVKVPILEQKSGKNEQAPIQLAGHVIGEDPIQVVQPKSLVNIRDNNVQLVNESDQPIQGDNGIALMDQSEDDEHFYDAVESQDTNSEEAQVNNTQRSSEHSSGPEQTLEILNEHHSNITANINDEGVGTTINDQSTSIISSDGEDKQIPVQQAIPIVPEELAAQTPPVTLIEDDVATVSQASTSNDNSDSSKIQLNESRTGSDQVSNQYNIAVTNENVKIPILEQKSDIKTNGKQSTNPNNGDVTAPKSLDKNSGKKDTQPKLIPTGVPLVASKDSNRVNNVQGNSKQPSYPDKNNPAPQNAKSKLPVIAAAMLAITGVATGIAIAVYLEMLMVGIVVGACCLVAATIIYYCNRPSNLVEPPASCNRPSSLLEGSNVEPSASASIV
ncbi:host RNA manipulator TomO [Wolbachia endosymbiont (group A) of Anomoia purmunda]|uniref:host RNA manipulator TomO n=1 Tax=Wolbachia endosymbiont (group A) of Anomoia purmunda TaxID=2953978 RepID=UPI002231A631|nr:lipase family protein [Wolbachia endosymbiont (group A) of Anomoia purmunda]